MGDSAGAVRLPGYRAVLLRDLLGVFRRQWLVALLVVVLGVLLGNLALPKVSYRATEVLIIQPPEISQIPNRLKDVRPSIAATSAVLAAQLKSPVAEAALRRSGVVGEYDLVPRNSGSTQLPKYRIPTLQVVVTANARTDAVRSMDLVVQAFVAEISNLQASWRVAPARSMTVAVLASPSVDTLTGSASRVTAATAGLTVGYAMALSMWADRRGFRVRLRSLFRRRSVS